MPTTLTNDSYIELYEGTLEQESLFEQHLASIDEKLAHVPKIDSGVDIKIATLKTLLHLVPQAELAYKNYPKSSNAYALKSLIAEINAISTELHKSTKSYVTSTIVSDAIESFKVKLGEAIIQEHHKFKEYAELNILKNEGGINEDELETEIDAIAKNIGREMETSIYELQERLLDKLS